MTATPLLLDQVVTANGLKPSRELVEIIQELVTGVETALSANDIAQAEAVVYSTYGDTVSVAAKAKNLNKFGRNRVVSTTYETVAEFQGTTSEETFVSTNLIDSISSSASGDTSKTYTIEGQTIDGNGNLTFVVQNATTDASDGQTKVALTTPLARATRMYLAASGTFNSPQTVHSGVIYVYDDTDGISGGVPVTAAATKILLLAGQTQSEKCATAISQSDYWFLTGFSAGVGNAGAASVSYITCQIQTRDVANGGVWRPLGHEIVLVPDQTGVQRSFSPFLIVPKNHDVRVQAKTDTSNAEVFAQLSGYLAAVS